MVERGSLEEGLGKVFNTLLSYLQRNDPATALAIFQQYFRYVENDDSLPEQKKLEAVIKHAAVSIRAAKELNLAHVVTYLQSYVSPYVEIAKQRREDALQTHQRLSELIAVAEEAGLEAKIGAEVATIKEKEPAGITEDNLISYSVAAQQLGIDTRLLPRIVNGGRLVQTQDGYVSKRSLDEFLEFMRRHKFLSDFISEQSTLFGIPNSTLVYNLKKFAINVGGEGKGSLNVYETSKEPEILNIIKGLRKLVPVHVLREELGLNDEEIAVRLQGLNIEPDYKVISDMRVPVLSIEQTNQVVQYSG